MGRRIDANFDSGTSDAIINWAAARLWGFTERNPRIRPDSAQRELVASVKGVVMRVGTHTLRQFRDRVLFLSQMIPHDAVARVDLHISAISQKSGD